MFNAPMRNRRTISMTTA